MSISGLLQLPEDVRIVPVHELESDIRIRIEAADCDYAISRPRSRIPASILNPDSVELLENFRQPARIVDAIVAFAGRRGRDPRATLDAAYAVLSRLYRMQLLVPAGGELASPIDGELRVGDTFAGFRLVRRIQLTNDNEVFLARDTGERYAAVKFHRSADLRVVRGLVREARLLRRIAGGGVPAVFGLARSGSGAGLAVEWIWGNEAQDAAALLQGADTERDENGLLSLCIGIASAFAHLHEHGVLHGDVHPGNILVEASGSARLIDFGLARDIRRLSADEVRGGVPFYFEPEFAAALRQGRTLAPSLAGEQYAVAVVLHQLWTGVHYLDWSLERDEMLRQIVEDDPVAFETRRVPPWPALEQVLRRALDKCPERRFPSLGSLAEALRDLLPESRRKDHRRVPERTAQTPELEFLDRTLERHSLGGRALVGMPEPASASIDSGAAGIAYMLLKVAERRGDPRLLAAADLWSQKAYAVATHAAVIDYADLQVDHATDGEVSLFHSTPGLHCVRALVSVAQGDVTRANVALNAFAEHATRSCASDDASAQFDLVLGKAGLLLGCAELIESLPDLPAFDLRVIRAGGAQLASDVLARVRSESIDAADLTTLGVAHGWGGLLFSLLRWFRAVRSVPDPVIRDRLRELAVIAEPNGAGLRWPIHTMGVSFMDGWCNGSAGHAMLFCLACQSLGEPRFGDVAERAAVSAWSSRSGFGSLCCGQGGIGYALLALYRATGEALWLWRARTAARRATGDRSQHFSAGALFKGALGVALLVEDLKEPEASAMPLFEPVC
jgi:serine/threonine-protein kinase